MQTDYAAVSKCISYYDEIFHVTREIIRLYNPKRNYFFVYNLAEDVQYSCLTGDIVEYTEESCPCIIRNLNHEKRLARFNKKYADLQKQR